MASGSEASCANDPNFAIVCSFFEKFSSMLNIQQPDIQLLQEWLENTDEVAPGLRDLHVKLLRKMRKTVHETAWESALVKFCYSYSAQDAWEIERFGYKKSSLKVKLRILTAILEYQFQLNGKFRNKFSNLSAEELRSEPIGRDRLGHSYWLTQDPSCNFRIYQEHLDEEIWQVVASNRSEMETLISRLKGNEVVLPSLIGVIDEDSSSNSCGNAVIKPPPPEEQDDSQSSSNCSNMKAKVPNIKIKLETSVTEKNGEVQNGSSKETKEEDTEEDAEEENSDEGEEEEGEEEEEEEDDDDEDEEDEEEEKLPETNGKALPVDEVKNDKPVEAVNGTSKVEVQVNGKKSNARKIKPLVISQSKISGNEEKSNGKKRTLENANGDPETDEPSLKKTRPTLLDDRHGKKSKYEKSSEEDEEEDDDEESEEEEDDEDDGDGVSKENEADDDEAANDDDADAEEEEAEEEEEVEDDAEDNQVGEAIEEKVLIVKGEGSGKECESSSTFFLRDIYLGCEENDEPVGEAIEEDVMYFYGEGNGKECAVGNSHEESNKSGSVLLERSVEIQPKVKSIDPKATVVADENKNNESKSCAINGEVSIEKDSSKTVNDLNADVKSDEGLKEDGLEIQKKELSEGDSKECALETNLNSKNEIQDTAEEKTESKDGEETDVPGNDTNSEKISEETSAKVVSEENKEKQLETPQAEELDPEVKAGEVCKLSEDKPQSENEVQDDSSNAEFITAEKLEIVGTPKSVEQPTKLEKSMSNDKNCDTAANTEESVAAPEVAATNSRKRRLSEEKIRSCSESESDLNSDSAAPPTEEDEDVGGKRPKMRLKAVNSEARKKIERTRKSNERHESTSEEENPRQDNNNVANGSADEVDPLQISDGDVLAAGGVEIGPTKVPTPVLIQTRTTRHTAAGTPIKVAATRGRGRKPGRKPRNSRIPEIPSLEPEPPIDEAIKDEDAPALDKMPKLEPEANGSKPGLKGTPGQRKPRGQKRDIDASNIIDSQADTPVRQSRRIAQLKIREEAERRKLEEEALKKMKAEFKKKKKEEKSSKGIPAPTESSEDTEEYNSEAEAGKKYALNKKKTGRVWKKDRWSSGPDEPEDEDEYDLPHDRYSEQGSPLFKSDHEFSPESDIEDESQAVPLKRARTARKEGAESDGENLDESCQKCGKKDHPEWILLCDKCDKGYHCSCLSPVLFIIPEGDWFCPPCQQEQLIVALERQMLELDNMVEKKRVREEEAKKLEIEQKQKEEEEQAKVQQNVEAEKEEISKAKKSRAERAKRRRNPKARKRFVVDDDEDEESEASDSDDESSASESSSNESESGSKSNTKSSDSEDDEPIYKLRKRRQVNVSYRLNEYEDLINSAIKEEMDEVAGAGNLGRGKDISTIIEADKEEKLRQRQLNAVKPVEETVVAKVETKEESVSGKQIHEDVKKEEIKEEEEEKVIAPVKSKSRSLAKNLRKKGRKLNNLDISSDDDGSDEDFKTSSYETEEDESISESTESDSSLEVYRKRGKKTKKKGKKDRNRRPQRRAARERRRLDDFIVEDSDVSDEPPKRRKGKRKHNWELQDTESEEDLSEQIDSEELCDDTTDSEDSDGCWRPSKRRKTKSKAAKGKSSGGLGARGGKQPRKFNKKEPGERSFKSKAKSKARRDSDDSSEDVPRTRGKRFTYLDSFDEESSDDGIKPGVKRPDTPPEEREKFIRKQEEIKRMLAEKNTEAAKAAATPTLAPVDSLSTVPLSVIKGAKALDIDYLQRKGELNSEDGDTDFDEDLPDDFDPEAMDEEEIAKMMEEEDFAQQQLKIAGDVIRQKKKDSDTIEPKTHLASAIPIGREPPASQLQEPPRKRLPMPTIHPPLGNAPRFLPPGARLSYEPPVRQHLPPTVPLSMQSVIQQRSGGSGIGGMSPAPPLPLTNPNTSVPMLPGIVQSQNAGNEPFKPRGRRKKITPLRDTLQKQQAAAAAAAAAAASSSIPTPVSGSASSTPTTKEITPVISSEKPAAVGPTRLSVAQPPQLYTPPVNTQPSVITRMPQQQPQVPRVPPPVLAQQQPLRPPRPPFPEQNSRFYPPPNQIPPHRMSLIRHGAPMPQHHALGPSFAGGPPPLRPASPRIPASVAGGVNRPPAPRPMATFAPNEYPPARVPPHNNSPHAYRPPLYGTPGYPPAPPQQPQTAMHPAAPDYPAVPTTYGPTPAYGGPYYPPPPNIGPTHSTPPPPSASVVPVSAALSPSSLPVTAAAPAPPAPVTSVAPAPTPPLSTAAPVTPTTETTIVAQSQPQRPKASVLETFDSKSRSPILEPEAIHSPYSNSAAPDDNDEENGVSNPPAETTSEFSGLVSYFSSQHDDLNS